jgi:hypothetical protein
MSERTDTGSLEERLRRVEDTLAIYQVISAYGPAADSGSLTEAADLWTEEGVYDIPGIGSFSGRADIIKLLAGELHQSLIAGGSAHVMSMPHVRISGDNAVAINYAHVYVPKDGEFGIFRVVASRWEMIRQNDSWRIHRRTNHLLDGRAEARQLLAEVTEEL